MYYKMSWFLSSALFIWRHYSIYHRSLYKSTTPQTYNIIILKRKLYFFCFRNDIFNKPQSWIYFTDIDCLIFTNIYSFTFSFFQAGRDRILFHSDNKVNRRRSSAVFRRIILHELSVSPISRPKCRLMTLLVRLNFPKEKPPTWNTQKTFRE